MAQASLDKLTKAIEQVEAKLSKIEAKLSGGSAAASSGAGGGASAAAWDALVQAHMPKFLELSNKIAPEIGAHAELFSKVLAAVRDLIVKASETKKPADISSFISGVAAAMGAVTDFEGKNRKTQFPNHMSAVSNGVSALGWVAVTPTPAPFAKEQGETAFMYTNRVLMAFKGKDETHTEWAKVFADFLKELPVYVKQYHTTGLTWA